MKTPELNKALVNFHARMEGNIKKQNQAHQYKYADLGSTLDVIREPLAASDLAVTQTTACYRDTTPPTSVLITTLLHSSGEEISSEFYLDLSTQSLKNANVMQNIGSTITYTRRYALQAILNLASEDDDGVSSNTKPPQKKTVTPTFGIKKEEEELSKFIPGDEIPIDLKKIEFTKTDENKYDITPTLLKFYTQALVEIEEISFSGRLLAWKNENNNVLLKLKEKEKEKYKEVAAKYNLKKELLGKG